MDNYNPLQLNIFIPLITIQIPVDYEPFGTIVNQFESYKVDNSIWDNSILKNRLSSTKFSINKHIGDATELVDELASYKQSEKHSRLSPFNIDSELFPNGILSCQWFKKYRDLKPFAFVHVLELGGDEDGDKGLVDTINTFKKKYMAVGVKYVCILLSKGDATQDDIRVGKIRQLTGLTRLIGVVYINTQNQFEKECEAVVSGLINNLKNMAIDFYTAIETKIKQRNKKYYSIPSSVNIDTTIELTPKFLETRNLIKQAVISQFTHPHNLEASISAFESAYQNLVLIIQENYFEFSKDKISDHDMKLYVQFRTLTDILAFHIVRGYLSIEDPITALKKHAAHILNVSNTTRGRIEINQWISIQYEWLAQLLSVLPKSILASANIKAFNNKRRSYKAIEYFGGVKFTDGSLDIILNPGLVYTKAESFLSSSLTEPDQLDFLKVYTDEKAVREKRLELLEKGVKVLESQVDGGKKSNYQYLCFKIAEELFENEQFDDAVAYYEKVLGGEWEGVRGMVVKRLVSCFNNMGRYDDGFLTGLSVEGMGKDLEKVSESVEYKGEFFDVDVVFCDGTMGTGMGGTGSGASESFEDRSISVFDPVLCQIVLKPKVFLTGVYELKVNRVFVEFESDKKVNGLRNMEVLNEEGKECVFVVVGEEENGEKVAEEVAKEVAEEVASDKEDMKTDFITSFSNLTVSTSSSPKQMKIIQLNQTVKKSGTYKIKDIQIDASLTINRTDTNADLPTNTDSSSPISVACTQKINPLPKPSSYHWLYKTINDSLIKVPLTFSPSSRGKLTVCPIKPNISVSMVRDRSAIIVGEKLCVPLKLQFNQTSKLNYKKVSLSPRVKITSDSADSLDLINPKINWENLKDDEMLVVDKLEGTKVVNLFLAVNSTSLQAEEELKKSEKAYKVVLDLKTIVVEDEDDSLIVYDTASYMLDVINSPFSCTFSVSPRYREGQGDMPNPFILHKEQNLSMPIITRVWQGNLNLVQSVKGLESSALEVRKVRHHIRPKNADTLLELLPSESETQTARQFTTRSRNGVSPRNVIIVASAEIEWERGKETEKETEAEAEAEAEAETETKTVGRSVGSVSDSGSSSSSSSSGSGSLYTFSTQEWEILLPVADPRVLLQVERILPKTVKLKYIIENPTARIFTFSSKLLDENERFIWNFDDERNMYPLTQPKFPVLPFNQFHLEYYGTFNTSDTVVQLPQLKVFDIQYKVSLPTLPAGNGVSIRDDKLYWTQTAQTSSTAQTSPTESA